MSLRLYFYAPPNATPEVQARAEQVDVLLRGLSGVTVATNARRPAQSDQRSTETPMDETDIFIIEGSTSDPEVGFLLAHAIATKKPCLYLFQKGTRPQILNHLSRPNLPSFVKVVPYSTESIERHVKDFLASFDGGVVRQVPRIKFTLRITDAIEEFLHFKTHNTDVTKADYLRQRIEELMDGDATWKTYLRKRKELE